MQLEVLIITGLGKLIIFIQKRYLCLLKWCFFVQDDDPELDEVTLDFFNFSVNPFGTKGLTLKNLKYILKASGLRYLSVASTDLENPHCPINRCSGTEN